MKNKGGKGFTLIVLLIVIAGLAYYVHLSNRSRSLKDDQTKSESQQLLEYDFENNYPKTVRDTVKLHCRYMKHAYNDKFTEEELVTVNKNVRRLFDDELLLYNTEQAQLEGLKKEIALYKNSKQKYVSYSLAEGSQIKYDTDKESGDEYAKMEVGIVVKSGAKSTYADEEYVLRKDSEGHWKILGWQTAKKAETEGDSENE